MYMFSKRPNTPCDYYYFVGRNKNLLSSFHCNAPTEINPVAPVVVDLDSILPRIRVVVEVEDSAHLKEETPTPTPTPVGSGFPQEVQVLLKTKPEEALDLERTHQQQEETPTRTQTRVVGLGLEPRRHPLLDGVIPEVEAIGEEEEEEEEVSTTSRESSPRCKKLILSLLEFTLPLPLITLYICSTIE
jgi:hypothetical protein